MSEKIPQAVEVDANEPPLVLSLESELKSVSGSLETTEEAFRQKGYEEQKYEKDIVAIRSEKQSLDEERKKLEQESLGVDKELLHFAEQVHSLEQKEVPQDLLAAREAIHHASDSVLVLQGKIEQIPKWNVFRYSERTRLREAQSSKEQDINQQREALRLLEEDYKKTEESRKVEVRSRADKIGELQERKTAILARSEELRKLYQDRSERESSLLQGLASIKKEWKKLETNVKALGQQEAKLQAQYTHEQYGKTTEGMREDNSLEEAVAELKEAGRDDILKLLAIEDWEIDYESIVNNLDKLNEQTAKESLWNRISWGFIGQTKSLHRLFRSHALLLAYFQDVPSAKSITTVLDGRVMYIEDALEKAGAEVEVPQFFQKLPVAVDEREFSYAEDRLTKIPEVRDKVISVEEQLNSTNFVVDFVGVGIKTLDGKGRRPQVILKGSGGNWQF